MKLMIPLATALLAAGCQAGGGDSAAAAASPCALSAELQYPAQGQEMYYRAGLEIALSGADPTASISLVDASGAALPGTVSLSPEQDLVSFMPDEPLSPSATYTAILDWCAGEAEVLIETSALGSPLSTSVAGRTYAVDPDSGRFIEPDGVGEILGAALGGDVLLGVLSDGASMELRGALSVPGEEAQDTCNRTVELPALDFGASPYFELPEGDVQMNIAGYDVTVYGMRMSGTFAADGGSFGGGTLSGELDARDMAPLLAEQLDGADAEALCELLSALSVDCAPCSSDGVAACVTVVMDQVEAAETGEVLEAITQADCHESCELSCENPECPEAGDYAICL